MEMDEGERLSVDLTAEERRLLMWGTSVWLGTGVVTEKLAAALWFSSSRELKDFAAWAHEEIENGAPLTPRQWRSLLAMAEVGFASQVFGAGLTWTVVTGFSDVDTVRILRSIQRQFRGFRGDKPWGNDAANNSS